MGIGKFQTNLLNLCTLKKNKNMNLHDSIGNYIDWERLWKDSECLKQWKKDHPQHLKILKLFEKDKKVWLANDVCCINDDRTISIYFGCNGKQVWDWYIFEVGWDFKLLNITVDFD